MSPRLLPTSSVLLSKVGGGSNLYRNKLNYYVCTLAALTELITSVNNIAGEEDLETALQNARATSKPTALVCFELPTNNQNATELYSETTPFLQSHSESVADSHLHVLTL